MNAVNMGKICHSCQFYRSISYANGECSIGCAKAAGKDGRPVDIRNLDICPLGHGQYKEPVLLAKELLHALGKIYAKTAPSAAYISLYNLLSESGKTTDRRRKEISLALQQLNILTVVAKSIEGQRGRRCIYRWNKKAGPPSLDMTDNVIRQVEEIMYAAKLAKKRSLTEAANLDIPTSTIIVYQGQTRCDSCWLKGLDDCRAHLMSFGIDCKKLNVNTLKHEAGLGFKEDNAEG